jgi:hypothetical protein
VAPYFGPFDLITNKKGLKKGKIFSLNYLAIKFLLRLEFAIFAPLKRQVYLPDR